MQRIISCLISVFIFNFCYAQTWTWMQGTDTLNISTSTGTLGTTGTGNRPGSMSGAVKWTDLNGNLWVFGGMNVVDFVNELWKFDVGTNQWTWVRGTGTVSTANYGTQGVPSVSNTPSARQGSASWTDASGDLWLFGGFGVTTTTGQGYA